MYESSKALLPFLKGDIRVVDAENIKDASEIIETADSFSLFSRKTATVVKRLYRNPKKSGLEKKLITWLEKQDPLPDIVFWEDSMIETDKFNRPLKKKGALREFITKNGKIKEYRHLPVMQLKKWLQEKFSKEGMSASEHILEKLILRVGHDEMLLHEESEKLILYLKALQKNEITEADLQLVSFYEPDHKIWDLSDAISHKDRSNALLLSEQLLQEQQDSLIILGATIKQLTQLLLTKRFPKEAVIKQLRMHPFVYNKSVSAAYNFTENQLKTLINKLIQLDYSVKKGLIDIKLGFTLLIISI